MTTIKELEDVATEELDIPGMTKEELDMPGMTKEEEELNNPARMESITCCDVVSG
jgi:hypothetical protein